DAQCYMQFTLFQNGEYLRDVSVRAQDHSCTFTAEEDGVYCIGAMYTSAGADEFTNCRIVID
ncbi:MAG: hypothetical protein IJP37_02165, partial [Clostridia bacterium]|nr:hypothetical protein [Clostridia bacterium]